MLGRLARWLRALGFDTRYDATFSPARALSGPVRRCPTCVRLYWAGSHVRRMERVLAAAFPEWWRV